MVAGNSLKKVRETRHFDLQSVAQYAKISENRLEEFEAGEREPSPRQLERLADTYGLASYLLSSGTIPNLPETIADFRRQVPGPAHLSPAGMARIWAAEEVAAVSTQLANAVGLDAPAWLKDVPSGKPTAAHAQGMRAFFDDWFGRRRDKMELSGAPEQQFMAGFRLFLEAQKTIVRINDAPPDDFLGFFIHPETGMETVFVNRKISTPKAQLFTILHEYSHKLLGLSGVSNPFVVRNESERACNRFAAEFLAPEKAFTELASDRARIDGRNDAFRLISAVSGRSLLSMHATAIRLAETGFLTQAQLKAWELVRQGAARRDLKNEEREDDEQGGGAVHAKLIGEVGYLPTYLAGLALRQKLIDKVDVQTGIGLTASIQEKAFALAARRFEAAAT